MMLRIALLALALWTAPLWAQVVTVDGREVVLNLADSSQAATYDSLRAWRAAYVDSASTALVAEMDSVYAAVLDSTGISLLPDLLDGVYVRIVVPGVERLLVAAKAQWIADGAEAVSGDTIRASSRLTASGLARLAPFYAAVSDTGGQ